MCKLKLQLYISQAYNNEMFSFVQDADEAEGDKDAMKRMFLDTDVSFNLI